MAFELQIPGADILWRGLGPLLFAQIERERRVLSRVADGEPLSAVLDDLLTEIEIFTGNGLKTSVLELSDDGQHLTHLAGPAIPAGFKEAIDGFQIGEGVGSCGTVVHRAAPVYVSDIENDPLWTNYRDIALTYNLRACWSTPIKSMQGDILGTFGLYYDARRTPSARDIEAISAITLTVALAIERHRADMKIRLLQRELGNSNARLARIAPSAREAGDPLPTPMARLQTRLRDPLITGTEKQGALTEVGRRVLELARQRIEENDRLLDVRSTRPVRLGIGSIFIDKFNERLSGLEAQNISLSSGICFEVADAFANRELDVAYVLDVRGNRDKLGSYVTAEHTIELAWVKAGDFQSRSGEPIPLAVYTGDRRALETLQRNGSDFRIMSSSKEYASKLSAVRSGKCVTSIPRNSIALPFEEIKDRNLPPVPTASILVAMRGDLSSERFKPLLAVLADLHL